MNAILQRNLGLPEEVSRDRFIDLLKIASPRLGIKKSEFAYIKQIIKLTMPQDYEAGAICTYFGQVTRIADKLDVEPRTINDYERRLNGKWIDLTVAKKGKRTGKRVEGKDGKILYAAGVSLIRLINQFSKIEKAAKAEIAHREHMAALRANLLFYRSKLFEHGFEGEAKEIYHRGRPTEIKSTQVLTDILGLYQAFYEEHIVGVNLRENDDLTESLACPNTSQTNNIKSCTTSSDSSGFEASDIIKIASPEFKESFDGYMTNNPTHLAFEFAAQDACQRLGIWLQDFQQVKRLHGSMIAALCTLIVDCNSQSHIHENYKARDARQCFGGMKRRLENKSFNIDGLLQQAIKAERFHNYV